MKKSFDNPEKPIPEAYPALDTDLARDNIENDLPDADLTDIYKHAKRKNRLPGGPLQ